MRAVLRLSEKTPLFFGIKMDGSLRRRIEGLTGADRRYVSSEGSEFLRICRLGEDDYIGKVVNERFSTERVDDIRRNVLSILQRLSPDTRFPAQLEVFACDPEAVEVRAENE